MLERLYIKHALPMLDCEDNRTFRKRCSDYGVAVYRDFRSNKLFVLKEKFEKALSDSVNHAIENKSSFLTTSILSSSSYTGAPMDKKPLFIPIAKRLRGLGLTVFCYKCSTNVQDLCKQTGRHLTKCPFSEKHAFKIYARVPNKVNERKTKILETQDVNEAIKQALEFQKEIKENKINDNKKDAVFPEKTHEVNNAPVLLEQAMVRDIERLRNINVREHRIENRSEEHIKDVERAFKFLKECLTKNKIDLLSLRMDQLDDSIVEMVFKSIKEKGFSIRTRNKYLSHFTSFITRHNQEYNLSIQNFFKTVRKRQPTPNSQMLTDQETFNALLNEISYENGKLKQEYTKGKKRYRNYYRPWLADGFRLALETGRRREEIISLRFSDIVNDDGILYIRVEDFKVNRIQDRTDSDKKYNYIPVTKSLYTLLVKLGYEKLKDTDEYILAPEIKNERNRSMADTLSHGFSHFYGRLKKGKKLTFKSLRKTYITRLSLYMGGNAKAITGHTNDAVIEKHYLDKKELVKAAQGFEVFPKENERKNELEQIRNNSKQNQIEMEV